MIEDYDIENYCKRCGRALRNGKCEYGCEYKRKKYINSHKYNFNKTRKIKMKTISKLEKKCYYCDKTENLQSDILPNGKKVYFCSYHFSWNYYSCKSKEYSTEDFSKYFMPGLIALVQKRKEKMREANE